MSIKERYGESLGTSIPRLVVLSYRGGGYLGMTKIATLKIDGMHCDACVRRVRAALSGVYGVHVRDVKVGSAEVEVDSSASDLEGAVNAVNDIGFSAHVEQR
jgi:copper chaperone